MVRGWKGRKRQSEGMEGASRGQQEGPGAGRGPRAQLTLPISARRVLEMPDGPGNEWVMWGAVSTASTRACRGGGRVGVLTRPRGRGWRRSR